MPILTGVIASGISGNLTPPWSPEGAYDALALVSVSSNVSSISFNGIPSGYKSLEIRGVMQVERTTYGVAESRIQFNGDTGVNYSSHLLQGYNGGERAASQTSDPWIDFGFGAVAATNTGNQSTPNWGSFVMTIPDYSNTSKFKSLKVLAGNDMNGSGYSGVAGRIAHVSGHWRNFAPIQSFTISSDFPMRPGTQFAIYGVK